jgi:hypothetical protein
MMFNVRKLPYLPVCKSAYSSSCGLPFWKVFWDPYGGLNNVSSLFICWFVKFNSNLPKLKECT